MSLADIFKNVLGGSPAPAPVTPTNNPNNNPQPQGTQNSAQTAPNGVVPQGANQGQEPSPGDKFKDLWNPPNTKQGDESDQSNALTPEKMLEAAAKVDFTKVLDQQLLAKVAGGGEEAVQALAQILNKQSQAVYGQSVVVTNKLIESAVNAAEQRFQDKLPGFVKNQAVNEALLEDNPAFNDPDVAPVIKALQQQLVEKFPTASAREIKALAREYLTSAAGKFGGSNKTETTQTKKETNTVDWDSYFKT